MTGQGQAFDTILIVLFLTVGILISIKQIVVITKSVNSINRTLLITYFVIGYLLDNIG